MKQHRILQELLLRVSGPGKFIQRHQAQGWSQWRTKVAIERVHQARFIEPICHMGKEPQHFLLGTSRPAALIIHHVSFTSRARGYIRISAQAKSPVSELR